MSFLTRMLRQTAVLWPQGSNAPDDYGVPKPGTAVQIKCRWEERQTNFVGKEGTTLVSEAVVYVDRDLAPGDVLMLGTLASITDASVPKNNAGAKEVRGWSKEPNLKATEWLRTAFL